MRTDVSFEGHGGVTLRGTLWVPDGPGPHPGVVMTHGFSAVVGHHLDRYAEVLAAAGMAVVAYDHRGFGASDGEPRQLINPWAQARDQLRALDWLEGHDAVDGERLGVWGSSFSGAEAVVVGAIDPRVRAVVANVPFTGLGDTTLDVDRLREGVLDVSGDGPADSGDVLGPMPVVEESPGDGAFLAGDPASAGFFLGADAPTWRNTVTLQGAFDGPTAWHPGPAFAHLQAALLMVVAEHDLLAPADGARAAFASVPGPKRLEVVDAGHFDVYDGPLFERTSAVMAEFLSEYLGGAS